MLSTKIVHNDTSKEIYMNRKLKEVCNTFNYIFFDIYSDCCDEEGFLKKNYSDNVCHLTNTIHSSAFIKHNLLNPY